MKITDFGISHAVGSATLTRPGTVVRTPTYLAPEQTTGRPATPAAGRRSDGERSPARPASAWEGARRAEYLRTALAATATYQCGNQDRRSAGHFAYAALTATTVAAISATGCAMTGMHGPASAHSQSSLPAATSRSSRGGSQLAHWAVPNHAVDVASATKAPVQGRQSANKSGVSGA